MVGNGPMIHLLGMSPSFLLSHCMQTAVVLHAMEPPAMTCALWLPIAMLQFLEKGAASPMV
jgi:hypothetical protein